MSKTDATATATAGPSGRHPVNIGHLVMGLAFLGLVGVWALIQGDVVTGDDIRWLLPLPWVVAGVAGLAASAVAGTRRHSVRRAGWLGDSAQTTATTTTTDMATDNQPLEDHEENS